MLRTASAKDAEAIANVHVKSWKKIYRGHLDDSYLDSLSIDKRASSWAKTLDERPDHTAVFEIDGQVVGFVNVCASRDTDAHPTTGELSAIYVIPHRWRRGVGTSLMTWATDSAASHGWSSLTLWVLQENQQARMFYSARGWRCDGTRKHDVIGGTPVVEVRYRRQI